MGSKNSNEYSGIKIKLYNFALSDQGRPKTLPPLRTLAKEYGCTHPTVLRAVRDLIVQGVVVPLKGGGYRTLQLDSAGEHHIVNYMFGNGMNLYVDHYTLQLRYHSLNTLTRQHVQLGVAEFRQSSAGDFAHEMTYGNCDAGLLVDPPAQIVEEIAGVCAGRNIPLGVFGSSFPGGDISCSFDVEKDFSQVFQRLLELERRRVLVLCRLNNHWIPGVQTAFDKYQHHFERAEFKVSTNQELINYTLENTTDSGAGFDTVVFVMFLEELHGKLKQNNPDILCVMPSFGTVFEPGFTGISMDMQMEQAGIIFGENLYRLMNKQPLEQAHFHIKCQLTENF